MNSLISKFIEVVRHSPNSTAIKWKDTSWSYLELFQRAGAVQALLTKKGIGIGSHVGISVSRNPSMIAAMLGTMASGALYVPLDPKYPANRLQFMAEDADCNLVFNDQINTPYFSCDTLPIPDTKETLTVNTEAEFAYIIYTSGSTGTPKGATIKHSSILQLLDWSHTVWDKEALAAVCAGTSISFDVSVFELFSPLTCGGTVVLMDTILEFIEHPLRESITLISTVPSAMTQLLRVMSLPASVKNVCIAGEAFPSSLASDLISPYRRIFNLYGPTEDTVFSLAYEVKTATKSIPIGYPIQGTQAHILNEDGELITDETEGELCLAGKGVSIGYLNRPELNKERFIPDPKNSEAVMYRTGDIVKRDENGLIHYCGRKDQQIKLRGFRIELGEILATIEKIPEVFEAVVLNVPNKNQESRLFAWVTPSTISLEEIKEHLSKNLPEYMIPMAIIPIKTIPRLPNGKLDRNALPQPELSRTGFVKMVNENERKIAQIFESVLGISPVGRHDDFTELGGNSLSATGIISRIREQLGVTISMNQFFGNSNVADLANEIEKTDKNTKLPAIERVHEHKWLTPIQRQMWIIEQLRPGRLDYLTALYIDLNAEVSTQLIVDSIQEIIKRHVCLHSIITSNQEIETHPDKLPTIKILAASKNPIQTIENALKESAKTAINICEELPLRVFICSNEKQKYIVGILIHHVAIDGWSIDILAEELTQLIAFKIGNAPPLSPLKLDTRDYAAWLQKDAVVAHHQKQLQKRVDSLINSKQKVNWIEIPDSESGVLYLDIPLELVSRITKKAKALHTTGFVIQLSTFAEVLCQYLAVPEIIIGTAAITRFHPDLEKIVACLTNLVPLKIARGKNLEKSCEANHHEIYEALDCAEIPFAKIVDALQVERNPNHNPLVQIAFGIEAPTAPVIHGTVRGKGYEVNLGHTRLDLTVWIRTSEDKITAIWNWKKNCLNKETIKKLHNKWIQVLDKGTNDPQLNWVMKREFKKLRNGKTSRRPISDKLFESFAGEDGITRVYKATSAGSSLVNFVKNQKEELLKFYHKNGALLLRNFQLGESSELADVVNTLFTSQVEYGERSSPRSDVSEGVYTSTDHPHDQPIVLHNEQSYTLNWPLRILFRCDLPAKEGGATPIADMRKVVAELKSETVKKFQKLGVLYQRNYHQGIGVSWQIAFQTDDPEVVAKYCNNNNIEYKWISENHLQTTQLRPAIRQHPENDELLFFNHALFFHITSLPPKISEGLQRALPKSHYPTQTYWGDGTDFEPEILEELRTTINRNTTRFNWQQGDLLILDNMKIAHGRDPFAGNRKIIVAMADPIKALYGEQSAIPEMHQNL